jgi:phage/plasmid-associated DNA primase
MDYIKLIFDDIESIKNDEDFEKFQKDENYFQTLVLREFENIKSTNTVICENIEECWIIIEKSDFKTIIFDNITVIDCNKDGDPVNNLYENDQDIKSARIKIILEYFKKIGVQYYKIYYEKNYIVFNCVVCKPHKTNMKMCISVNGFNISSFSQSDCSDERHHLSWDKWKKDLNKMWKESKAHKELTFSLSDNYTKKFINLLPPIIKDKNTNILNKYTGKFYEVISNIRGNDEFGQYMRKYCKVDGDTNLTSKQKNDFKSVLDDWGWITKNQESYKLINCKNGVLDINTMQLLAHNKDFYFNHCLDVEYNPEIESQKLINVVKEILEPGEGENCIELFKKILGFIYINGEKLEKGFIFKGTKDGRNGKGTLAYLIAQIIGEHLTYAVDLNEILGDKFATYNLIGKRLLYEDDYKTTLVPQETIELINKVVSKALSMVQQKYMPAIKIKYEATPIICTNEDLKLSGKDDGGFYSRMIKINFNRTWLDNETSGFKEKLWANPEIRSTLLNWMIEGIKMYENWMNGGNTKWYFKESETKEREAWKTTNNKIQEFILDEGIFDENYCCSIPDLYNYFSNDWNKGGKTWAKQTFTKEIIRLYPNLVKDVKKIKGKTYNVLLGIYFENDKFENCKIIK